MHNRPSTSELSVLMTLDDVCRCIDALNAAESRCAEVTTWAGSEEGKACLRAVDEAYVKMAKAYVRYQKKLEMEREVEMKAENEEGRALEQKWTKVRGCVRSRRERW